MPAPRLAQLNDPATFKIRRLKKWRELCRILLQFQHIKIFLTFETIALKKARIMPFTKFTLIFLTI
jgi:hypothetical protein